MSSVVTAQTQSGSVQGLRVSADPADRRNRDISVFRGIPFAAAPIGNLRFAAPVAAPSWDGVRDATSFTPVLPQKASGLESMFGAPKLQLSEDALALNVWTPGCDDAKRPVMVWIHGGAFVTGSGSTPWYDCSRFAANHDLVMVTINYRLGAFGYLNLAGAFPEMADEHNLSANVGLLDQVAALEWVRANIADFGGDPDQVTIFGESAGAMSCATLLVTPAAKGLFHKAILQSGALNHVHSPDRSVEVVHDVLRAAELAATRDSISKLREMPLEQLLSASQIVSDKGGGATGLPFQPTMGVPSLPHDPFHAIESGFAAGIDLLFGTTRDEMRLFTILDTALRSIDVHGLAKRIHHYFGESAVDVAQTYVDNRSELAPGDVWPDIATDMVFRWPAQRLATSHAPHTNNMYAYEFRWPTPAFGGRLKSCHALEIPFVFDNLDQPGIPVFTGDGPERQGMADLMHTAWANFARHGNPNIGAALPGPAWPAFEPMTRPTYVIDAELEVEFDPRGDELRLWADK